MFSVEASDTDMGRRVCTLASEAAAQLAQCHLPQLDRIKLQVVDHFAHIEGYCLGRYEVADAALKVSSPDSYPDLIEPDHVFYNIPVQQLFKSVIVHELSHAILQQQSSDIPHCIANHEYIAYAMQMQSLSPESRQIIVDNAGNTTDVTLEHLNSFIAQAAPMKFAAWSWLHFSGPEGGCDFIEKLVSGEATLKLPND